MASGNQSVAMVLRCCSLPVESAALLEDGLTGPTTLLAAAIGQRLPPGSVPESVQSLWSHLVASLLTTVQEGTSDVAWLPSTVQEESMLETSELFARLIAFGPKGCGTNLLIFAKDVKMDVWLNAVPKDSDPAVGAGLGDGALAGY